MKGFRRSMIWALALCACLAAAPAAGAKPPKPNKNAVGVDQSFGVHGSYAVATTSPGTGQVPRAELAVAPDGEAYVLQGRTILAFGPDGKPDKSFGNNGRVWVNPGPGEVEEVSGIAVDSVGRVLVAGTYVPFPGFTNPLVTGSPQHPVGVAVTEAFIIRYLTDASPDPVFGSDGVTITTFGVPRPTDNPSGGAPPAAEYEKQSVSVSQLFVDAQDRPVLGGQYIRAIEGCAYVSDLQQSFVARLTNGGVLDASFGNGAGYVQIPGGHAREVTPGRGGELVAISSIGEPCIEHSSSSLALSVLTESGAASPSLDPSRPQLGPVEGVAVDHEGDIVFVERADPDFGNPTIVRLLPNGTPDTGFGFDGGANLTRFAITSRLADALDSKGRTVVAFGSKQPEILRLSTSGKVEHLGKNGVVRAPANRSASIATEAVAIDSKGRIVIAGKAEGAALRTGFGVGIARFLPGK